MYWVMRVARKVDWSISALRFLAMALIVATHLCQLYDLGIAWWLNSAVQVFLFISGWLFGSRPNIDGARKWLGKRFLRICVPFWILGLFLLLADVLFVPEKLSVKNALLALFCLRSGYMPNGTHLWYISVMLLCYLLTPVLSYMWKRWRLVSMVALAALLVFVGNHIVPNGIWCVDYIAGFALARIVRDGRSEVKVLRWTAIACGGGCLFAVALWYFGLCSPYKLLHFLAGPFCFAVLRLALGLAAFTPSVSMRRILEWGDNYSYEVYLVHQIVILGDFSLSLVFPDNPVAVVAGAIVWSIATALILHSLSGLVYERIDVLRN
jgi:peptidoglycan/LPS O-acetylase OafA/YrhL